MSSMYPSPAGNTNQSSLLEFPTMETIDTTYPSAPDLTQSPSQIPPTNSSDSIAAKYSELQEQQSRIKQLQEQQKQRIQRLEEQKQQRQQQQQQQQQQLQQQQQHSFQSPSYGSNGLNQYASPTAYAPEPVRASPQQSPQAPQAQAAPQSATQSAGQAQQQQYFMKWVQDHMEKLSTFMSSVDRRLNDLEERVREISIVQKDHRNDKHDIIQHINMLKNEVSSARVSSTATSAISATAPAPVLASSYPPSHRNQEADDEALARSLQEQFMKEQQQSERQASQQAPLRVNMPAPAHPQITGVPDPCPICQSRFATHQELQIHVQQHLNDEEEAEKKPEEQAQNQPWWQKIFGVKSDNQEQQQQPQQPQPNAQQPYGAPGTYYRMPNNMAQQSMYASRMQQSQAMQLQQLQQQQQQLQMQAALAAQQSQGQQPQAYTQSMAVPQYGAYPGAAGSIYPRQ